MVHYLKYNPNLIFDFLIRSELRLELCKFTISTNLINIVIPFED